MPQPAVQFEVEGAPSPLFPAPRPAESPASGQPTIVTLGETDVAWAASPARQLHDRLVESFAPHQPRADAMLSRRQRLLILAGSVTLLWAAIGGAVLLA